MAASFVRCEDPALLAQAVGAPAAEQLEMRLLAPTVAVSQAPISEVLAALRTAGFAPAAEDSTGSIVDIRARGARVPAPALRRLPRQLTAPTGQTLGAIVAVLRKVAAQPFANMRIDPAVAISQLQEAARLQNSVVIGYVDPAGVATQRVVAPVNVRGGQLTAYDPRQAGSGSSPFIASHPWCRPTTHSRTLAATQLPHRTIGEYGFVSTILAAAAQAPYRHGLSLLHGWLPMAVQAGAAAALVAAIGWRTRRWRLVRVPAAIAVGVAVALWAHWFIDSQGMAGDPAPRSLMVWIGLTGLAVAVAVLGWRETRRWRRGVSVLAVPLCLLSAGIALNLWVGYFPTVQLAWNELTAGPLPDETDMATVADMQRKGVVPEHGVLLPVTIPNDASQFKHRTELVYLPPAWFATNPPPKLPVVMMIAGEFNTPSDWPRTGNAIATIDSFAGRTRRRRTGVRVRRRRRLVQQRHRMRQRPSRQRRRPPHQGCSPYLASTFGVSTDGRELGHRRLVDGRHMRDRPHRDASGVVRQLRRHRGRHGAQRRNQGADDRQDLRRRCRRVGRPTTRRR